MLTCIFLHIIVYALSLNTVGYTTNLCPDLGYERTIVLDSGKADTLQKQCFSIFFQKGIVKSSM